MRPEWHCCDKCYFGLIGSDDGWWCHFDQIPTETVENSFCSKWICGACGGSWDEGDSHDCCLEIEVELEF